MEDSQTVNYALALKNYQQKGFGRSMKRFCEEEGYDYTKFMRYARRGQRELSVLKTADEAQPESKFLPLVIDREPSEGLRIQDVRVRFTNGLELSQQEGDINELLEMVRKILG